MKGYHRLTTTVFLMVVLLAALVFAAGASATTAAANLPISAGKQTAVFSAPEQSPLQEQGPTPEYAIIHYSRPAGDYGTPSSDFNTYWGLHLWGDGLDPGEGTDWTNPKPFSGVDDYGAYVAVKLADPTKAVNYIVHKGSDKDTPSDRSFVPSQIPVLWIKQGDGANYASRAAVTGMTVIHYQRSDGNYDGWGLDLSGDAIDPTEATEWTAPKLPTGIDDYGAYFEIKLKDPTQAVNFVVHKGDDRDPDADRELCAGRALPGLAAIR